MAADTTTHDIVLIGAGIMSATLGVLLKELNPSYNIQIFETLDEAALESSDAWNNAGTGHAANMEFNYTPERSDGTVDVSKALEINTEFDLSRQFWAYLVKKGAIADPQSFIHPVPHMGFVHGSQNIPFLRKRYAGLTAHHVFRGMEYTEDKTQLKNWVPLIMEGRDPNEAVAATRIVSGADVDYGSLTRHLIGYLKTQPQFTIHFNHHVTDIKRDSDQTWIIEAKDKSTGQTHTVKTKFVYIAAGGASLLLLQKSKIPQGQGYGGFPVSGIWLRCDDPDINAQHHAKVYGQEPVGSPPMSAPHLDTRIINGKQSLLFGPYAGFSTKFLKHGSLFDLFASVKLHNIAPLLTVAKDNLSLVKYLIGQIFISKTARFNVLRQFYPNVSPENWRLQIAGQRVQIIRPDPKRTGFLEFGTELIASNDNSLIALLGASPGASTAVYIALSVLQKGFKGLIAPDAALSTLQKIIPSYGHSLLNDEALCNQIRTETAAVLHLKTV